MEHAMKSRVRDLARYVVPAAILGCLGSFGVQAADSTITVTGEVYAEPCTVSSTSAAIDIDLGQVSAKDFQTANASSANWSAVKKITLTNCPAGTKTVTAKFDGTADTDDNSYFKNSGTAKNLSVWLAADTGGTATTIKPEGTQNATVTSSGAEFPIKVKLYTKKGSVEAGSVSSTISVTLSYN